MYFPDTYVLRHLYGYATGAGSMKRSAVRLSVCLSVSLSRCPVHSRRTRGQQPADSFINAHTHLFNGPLSGTAGLPGWAGTRNIKPIWILLKQETVSGSGISSAVCKSAPRSRQITTPVPHHSVFYRPDALPAAQPTVSKHWSPKINADVLNYFGQLFYIYRRLLSQLLLLQDCTAVSNNANRLGVCCQAT